MQITGGKWFGIFTYSLCLGCVALAQTPQGPATGVAGPSWSPSQNIGLFAFPRNGQSADQQLKDEADCYGAAKQRTGIDAQAAPPQGFGSVAVVPTK
jgi:hypothetical protein